MTKRDDFTGATKDLLAQRVGYRCSNPNCRILTSGPGDAPAGTTNVGVAAHVTAAAIGGPRFDNTLSATERRAPENGIWLCQVHAKLIDDAPSRFTADLLRAWKRHSEEAARMEIEELDKEFPQKQIADIAALKVYATAFDRNAFKDNFRGEVCMSAFDQAIKDTVLTIATGILRDRDGRILRQTLGRQELHHRAWRDKLGIVLEPPFGALSRSLLKKVAAQVAPREFSGFLKTGAADAKDYKQDRAKGSQPRTSPDVASHRG